MRMNRWIGAACVMVAATLASAADVVSGEQGKALDESILRAHLGQFWGAVGVVKDGRVVLAKGYGLTNRTLVPISSKTLFDIGSVTKQFTAAAILRLEMDGKLSIDDRAAMWVDDVPRENQGITIRHLLTHTSGISQRDVSHPDVDTGAAVATAALSAKARRGPGDAWEYSNAGYFALAAIVERASGQTYEQYLKEHLFVPAGMTSTAIMGDGPFPPELLADRVGETGRARGNAGAWPYPVKWGYMGAGGVVSNVEDMLAWDAALRTEAVLNAAAKEKFFTAFKKDYACGWQCETGPQGRIVSHSGGVEGFVTFYTRWLDTHAAIVVLTNGRGNPQAVDAMLRKGLFPPEGPELLAEVNLGQYELNEFQSVTLKGEFSITGAAEGKGVRVSVNDPTKQKPLVTLRLSKDDAARLEGELSRAISSKGANAKLQASECGVYARPYPKPADGVLRLTGEGISCMVTASMGESGGGRSYTDQRITLTVRDDDNSFMPVMLRLDVEKAKELRKALTP